MDENVRMLLSDIRLLGAAVAALGVIFSALGALVAKLYFTPKIEKAKKCVLEQVQGNLDSFEKRQNAKYDDRFYNKLEASQKFIENDLTDRQQNKDIESLEGETKDIHKRIDGLKRS